jgi:hypothetical protein
LGFATFKANATAASNFDLHNVFVGDAFGDAISTAVSEPESIAIFILGLMLLGLKRKHS